MSIYGCGKKLNMQSDHRKSVLRNQVILLINSGKLVTTRARAKVVKRIAERLVTVARKGSDFTVYRYLNKVLPYDKKAVSRLVETIAPRYVDRPGGYLRYLSLGTRVGDTAPVSMLTWV